MMSKVVWTLPAFVKHSKELRRADQRAIKVLADSFENRMANTNEWRGAIEDQQKNFALKSDTERRLKEIEDWRIATSNKQIGATQLYGAAAAVIFVIVAVLGVVFMVFKPGG
jgi:hypothetical protein